ncbi:MAG: hypothetical protein FWE37_00685 [Spirochaetaceae bacterium]|nr:hypothetical protein [Spirochaetaceae bacterium]
MKRIVLLVIFIAVFLMACASSNSNQQNSTITIVNRTGFTVFFVYFSPVADNYWGPNRLRSNQVLRNGQSVTLPLPHPLNVTNRYDFRLVDLDGDSYIKQNILVTNNSAIIFTFSDFVGR